MKKLEPNAIMKSKLQPRTSATILLFIIWGSAALAQNSPTPPRPGEPIAPGMPPPQPHYTTAAGSPFVMSSQTMTIDPATGLPLSQPEWKDPNWNDPDKTLPEVFYDGLPVSEIAHNLSDEFKGEFDMLLPQDFGVGRQNSEGVDWVSTSVHLRLKNVKASEVFNAMNLLFENNRTPLRWELKMNGSRRIALLRVLEDPRPADTFRRPEIKRVYFVGDLIGDEKSGGMSMAEIVNTISEVWKMTYGQSGVIQFHDKAQLLIVTGTDDQVTFIQQTLEALHTKAAVERGRKQEAEFKSKANEPKTSGVGGSK